MYCLPWQTAKGFRYRATVSDDRPIWPTCFIYRFQKAARHRQNRYDHGNDRRHTDHDDQRTAETLWDALQSQYGDGDDLFECAHYLPPRQRIDDTEPFGAPAGNH